MDIAPDLKPLEDAIRSLAIDAKVEIDVTLKIHDDVPAEYVESTVTDGGTYFRKVIDAQNGIVTKSVRIFIPD